MSTPLVTFSLEIHGRPPEGQDAGPWIAARLRDVAAAMDSPDALPPCSGFGSAAIQDGPRGVCGYYAGESS